MQSSEQVDFRLLRRVPAEGPGPHGGQQLEAGSLGHRVGLGGEGS